jgi:hypothetical protein
MWPVILRFWKPLLGALLVLAILWVAYSHGRKAERAEWEPRFAAAERAKAAADARAEAKEELAKRLSAESDTRYADTIFRLNERAIDTQRGIDRIVRELAARAGGGEVPADPAATRSTDAASTGDERLERAAAGFGDLARRCEADALRLVEFQRWVTEQRAALN